MSGRQTTRRSFISITGAALSAPLAAAGATIAKAPPAPLDDRTAICALNQAFTKHVNRGDRETAAALFADPSTARIDPGIRGVTSTDFGEHDVITIAADGQTATGRLHCSVETETAIGPECPLVAMARQQGGGMVRHTDEGAFEHAYIKRGGTWKIRRAEFRAAVRHPRA